MFDTASARLAINSHLDWWAMAGLDTMIDEAPRNWLAAPPEVAPGTEAKNIRPVQDPEPARPKRSAAALADTPVVPTAPLAPLEIPEQWDAFQHWLATAERVPGTGWNPQRILPVGTQGARLMILSLTPEMEDFAAGALHSGAPGALLDAMLRAIGLTREQCYLASLALTRPPGGRLDSGEIAGLTPPLWHHLRLARPERLLLFGSDLAQTIASTDLAAARGRKLFINQDGVKVEAVAIQHPQLLLDRPARKAAAWDSLKHLAQG